MPHRRVLGLAALAAASACTTPLPHDFTDTTRHLCCNLHYEKTKISDVNFQRGTLIPLGTPVRITQVTAKGIVFEAPGHPPITLLLRYGRRTLTLDDYLAQVFLTADPRPELARLPRARREAVTQSRVEPGMSRDEVLMALGYPPAHRTPVLDASTWIYWQNRWQHFAVHFDADRVARVQR